MLRPILTLSCFLLLSGCAIRSDFTAISSKNVNLSSIKVDKSQSKGQSTGKDCTHIIIFIPTGGNPTLDEAVDKALESKQADILMDATVMYHWFYIPYIYGQACWDVKGEAYDTY